jgi:hypothetical protein
VLNEVAERIAKMGGGTRGTCGNESA